MKFFKFWLSSLLLLSVTISYAAHVNVIISTPPSDREVILPPTGYTTCHIIPAGFYHHLWIPARRVCQYPEYPAGNVWVAGYWACDQYGVDGACYHWRWFPAHWERHQLKKAVAAPGYYARHPVHHVSHHHHHQQQGYYNGHPHHHRH